MTRKLRKMLARINRKWREVERLRKEYREAYAEETKRRKK